jgi:hypothetical protein
VVSVSGGHKFTDAPLPPSETYQLTNTPVFFGQGINNLLEGASYLNATAKLSLTIDPMWGVVDVGVTAGSIGGSFEDMKKLGIGALYRLPFLQNLTVGAGWLFGEEFTPSRPNWFVRFGT